MQRLGILILSLFGPIYFGVRESPAWLACAWGLAIGVWLSYQAHRSLQEMAKTHNSMIQQFHNQPGSWTNAGFPIAGWVGSIGGVLLLHVVIYFIVRWLAN